MISIETIATLKYESWFVFGEYGTCAVEFCDIKGHGFSARRGRGNLGKGWL
jgi:hypothetical protein